MKPHVQTPSDKLSVEIRKPKNNDINELIDLDLKCFDNPWTFDQWRYALAQCATSVACYFGRPVGVCCSFLDRDILVIEKFAVRSQYRRQQVGSRLFQAAHDYAELYGCNEIIADVPEHMAYLAHPWFNKHGFKPCLIRDRFTFCGEPEDGVRFSKLL